MTGLAIADLLSAQGGDIGRRGADRDALCCRLRHDGARHSGRFFARDQRCGKALWMLLFGPPLTVLVTLGDNADQTTFGGTPAGLTGRDRIIGNDPAPRGCNAGTGVLAARQHPAGAKTHITRAASLQRRIGMSRRAGVHPMNEIYCSLRKVIH